MTFAECDEEIGSSLFVNLKKDGETLSLFCVGEPVPREETYAGRTRVRAYFPVLTDNGLQMLGVGAKSYRHLKERWADLKNMYVTVTRNGVKGSLDTTYSFKAKKATAAQLRLRSSLLAKDITVMVNSFLQFDAQAGSDIPI